MFPVPANQAKSPIPTAPGGTAAIMAALGLDQGVPTGGSVLPAPMTAQPPAPSQPAMDLSGPPQAAPMGPPQAQGLFGQGPPPALPMTPAQQTTAVPGPVSPPPSNMAGPLVPLATSSSPEQAAALAAVVRALIAQP